MSLTPLTLNEARGRMLAIACLSGVALTHVLELERKLDEGVIYMAVMFTGLSVSAVLLAVALAVAGERAGRRALRAAGVMSVSAIAGYLGSRAVAFPQMADHVGDWLNPLGIASLVAEATLVALAAQASLARRPPGLRASLHAAVRPAPRREAVR